MGSGTSVGFGERDLPRNIVGDARRGDLFAVEAVYRWLAPPVLGYLRGEGARHPEDLLGDVFVAVVRGLGSFEGDAAALRRWVFTIAHHRLVDERRQTGRRPEDPTDPATLPPLSRRDVFEFEEGAVARLDARPVLGALDDLTPDQRSVLLLRLLADMSVADTARVLGKDEGAVKALTRRGLASLSRAVAPRAVS